MQGVMGVYSKEDASTKSLYILYGVQHRGQESAGITAASDGGLRTLKGRGLVSNVFDERFSSFIHPSDYVVIGSASGETSDSRVPSHLDIETDRYEIALTLDGYVPEKGGLSNEEAFAETLVKKLETKGVRDALADAMRTHTGSYYSLVMAARDKDAGRSMLLAARDARGVRPLYMALKEGELYIASESAPIDVMENMGEVFRERRDLTPGSMVTMSDEGLHEEQVLEPCRAHCAFEWVYFGRPDSVIEGVGVHNARKRLGHALVETHNLGELYCTEDGTRADMAVIPVPDSGRSVCTGVAEALGVTADEGVIKNAYLGRTYIIYDPEFRKIASDLKHNIIRGTVEGRKVIITDDSIVRGTVSESVAQNLLEAGATEVEFLVSYAPIFYPCFSDPTDKPLAAKPYVGRGLEEIGDLVAKNLPSINKVRYNSLENVLKAIGLPEDHICVYCITGKDPFRRRVNRFRDPGS
jgi:amidophosphoribosyltransferase